MRTLIEHAGTTGTKELPSFQGLYYLDPQNTTGNASDSNSGNDPTAPLLTFATALGKRTNDPITVYIKGTVRPADSGGFTIGGQGAAIAKDVQRTAYAKCVPWPPETSWSIAPNYNRLDERFEPIIAQCSYFDLRNVTLHGSRFTVAFPSGGTICHHVKIKDWVGTANPDNQTDSTKQYGYSSIVLRSTDTFEITGLDLSGGDWSFPGTNMVALVATADNHIKNGTLQAYLHDYIDSDGLKAFYTENVDIDLRVRRTNRLNGTSHVDTVQFEGEGNLPTNLKLDIDDTCYGAHVRTTDVLAPWNGFRLHDSVCGPNTSASHDFALTHMPGMIVEDCDIQGFYLEGLATGGAAGARLRRNTINRYNNTSGQQIAENTDNVVTTVGGGSLPLP